MRSIVFHLLLASPMLAADSPVSHGAKPIKLSGSFKFTEGPIVDAEGNVHFTDQPNDRIHFLSAEGKPSTFLEPADRSNGLSSTVPTTSANK